MSAALSLDDWKNRAGTLSFRSHAFINGRYVEAASGKSFDCVNPATGRVLTKVAAGDLTPRVRFEAEDELGVLGRAFNSAIQELDRSRARIEFLRHMSEWQTIARRLAHEIRNPLTPIQLAVQECQRRYDGSDPAFQQLLATTVEVVEEEVASLRRLVGR